MYFEANFQVSESQFTAQFSESGQEFDAGVGALQIINGKDGKDGKSAYDIAVANGFEGTEAEWLESLKGEDGADGVPGKDGKDYVLTEVDKQEIAKMVEVTGGGVTSWNDLTDRPFGSTFELVELANATSAVSYDAELTQCSCSVSLDFTPIQGELYKLVATDGTQTIEAEHVCSVFSLPALNMYSVTVGRNITDDAPIYMYTSSASGPWAVRFKATSEEGAMWTITVSGTSEIVTPLDRKYLPNGIPFVASASVGQGIAVKAVNGRTPTEFEAVTLVKSYKDLTDVPVGEKNTTLMSERTVYLDRDGASLGQYSLGGCNLVCFDGVEYEVLPFSANMYATNKLYGNPNLWETTLPSNGMPFVLANNQISNWVTLKVSELGTYTISAYKREVDFLDEKYIPDTIARVEDIPTVADLIAALPIYNGEVESV